MCMYKIIYNDILNKDIFNQQLECVCETYPVACVLRWGKVLSMEEEVTLKYNSSMITIGIEKKGNYILIYYLVWTD